MHIMNKTPNGTTLCANRWDNGISCGIYGEGNCFSFEYNPDTKQIELLIMDEEIARQGIVVKHVNDDWTEIV